MQKTYQMLWPESCKISPAFSMALRNKGNPIAQFTQLLWNSLDQPPAVINWFDEIGRYPGLTIRKTPFFLSTLE